MQVHDGVGHAYLRSSLQKRKQCLWVRALLCLRSKRLHVQEAGFHCFLSVPFQRSYIAPTAASLHCVDTSVCPSFFLAPCTILQCLMMTLALCSFLQIYQVSTNWGLTYMMIIIKLHLKSNVTISAYANISKSFLATKSKICNRYVKTYQLMCRF